jgi:hypothetical protein
MKTRILVLTAFAALSAMAASVGKPDKQVNFDTRPKGSEWLGDWTPELTEERLDYQTRIWADAARSRMRTGEAKATAVVPAKPAAGVKASSGKANSASSR